MVDGTATKRNYWQLLPLYPRTPIDNTLECDSGILIGGCHFRVVRVVRWGSWSDPISRARVPFGAKRASA